MDHDCRSGGSYIVCVRSERKKGRNKKVTELIGKKEIENRKNKK